MIDACASIRRSGHKCVVQVTHHAKPQDHCCSIIWPLQPKRQSDQANYNHVFLVLTLCFGKEPKKKREKKMSESVGGVLHVPTLLTSQTVSETCLDSVITARIQNVSVFHSMKKITTYIINLYYTCKYWLFHTSYIFYLININNLH